MKITGIFFSALFAFAFPFLSYAGGDPEDLSFEDREIEPLPQTDARINGYREDYKKPKEELIQLPEKYRKKKKKSLRIIQAAVRNYSFITCIFAVADNIVIYRIIWSVPIQRKFCACAGIEFIFVSGKTTTNKFFIYNKRIIY